MIGAFLAGYLFQKGKKVYWLAIGEIIGSGLLGALASYPVARIFLDSEAALFGFVPVFAISAIIGAVIGVILVYQLMKRPRFKQRIMGMIRDD